MLQTTTRLTLLPLFHKNPVKSSCIGSGSRSSWPLLPPPLVVCRRNKRFIFFKSFFSLRKDAREVLKKTSGLEKAMVQKMIYEDLGSRWGGGGAWVRRLLLLRPKRSGEYVNALVIYEKTAAHANSPEFKGSSLKPGFKTWIETVFLHVWLLHARFRYTHDPGERKRMLTHVLDYFWEDLEMGLVDTMGTSNPLVITKHSKLWLNAWYGCALAYDVGSIRGDPSLAEAIWRNLYESDPNVPLTEIAAMVDYVRYEQHRLMQLPNEVFTGAEFNWSKAPFQMPEGEKARLIQEQKLSPSSFLTTPRPDPLYGVLKKRYEDVLKK